MAVALAGVFTVDLLLTPLLLDFGVEPVAGKARPKVGSAEKRMKMVAESRIMKIEYIAAEEI